MKENNVVRERTGMSEASGPRAEEETLVADARVNLTPSQHVEQKLIELLNGSSVLVSQVQRRLRPGPR